MSSLPHRDRVIVAFVMAAIVVIVASILSSRAPSNGFQIEVVGVWEPQDANFKKAHADCRSFAGFIDTKFVRMDTPQGRVFQDCLVAKGYSLHRTERRKN